MRPGYDPAQVDASLRQLVVRLENAEQAEAALRREVTSLQRQHPTFELLVEQAALYAESSQVCEFRDGLLEELGRVHGDISALASAGTERRPGQLSASARQNARRPGPAG